MSARQRAPRAHKAGPVGGAGRVQGWCTCGWNGPTRFTKAAAERDVRVDKQLAEAHRKGER